MFHKPEFFLEEEEGIFWRRSELEVSKQAAVSVWSFVVDDCLCAVLQAETTVVCNISWWGCCVVLVTSDITRDMQVQFD